MRFGVVGAGSVGSAAFAFAMRDRVSRLTPVDLDLAVRDVPVSRVPVSRELASRELAPRVVGAAPRASRLVASAPADVLAQLTFEASGLPGARVIGAGTAPDSARLRSTIGRRSRVAPEQVYGYVPGDRRGRACRALRVLQRRRRRGQLSARPGPDRAGSNRRPPASCPRVRAADLERGGGS